MDIYITVITIMIWLLLLVLQQKNSLEEKEDCQRDNKLITSNISNGNQRENIRHQFWGF